MVKTLWILSNYSKASAIKKSDFKKGIHQTGIGSVNNIQSYAALLVLRLESKVNIAFSNKIGKQSTHC